MSDPVEAALSLWGMQTAACEFIAGRENRVYRVRTPEGDFALRFKRPGYRTEAELASELLWMGAMEQAGLNVPRPLPSLKGKLLEPVADSFVDMISWLSGAPMGQSRVPLSLPNAPEVFRALGAELARLHIACSAWQPPTSFQRGHWDIEGLLGEAPLWGRFWENPSLDPATKALFLRFREIARQQLDQADAQIDYGLIHADLVRENVLLDGPILRLIDFDDGGFGYRLFDLATIILKNQTEPDRDALNTALIKGYQSQRPLDLSLLALFLALRTTTYVGWIVPRIAEDGSAARNTRFINEAREYCGAYLQTVAG